MIYINAVDDSIKIEKAIGVSLPTKEYDVEMKLYRGEEKEGEINWVQPQSFVDTVSTYLQRGKNLFQASCANYHAYDKALPGPAMKGLEGRVPWVIEKNYLRLQEMLALIWPRIVTQKTCFFNMEV